MRTPSFQNQPVKRQLISCIQSLIENQKTAALNTWVNNNAAFNLPAFDFRLCLHCHAAFFFPVFLLEK